MSRRYACHPRKPRAGVPLANSGLFVPTCPVYVSIRSSFQLLNGLRMSPWRASQFLHGRHQLDLYRGPATNACPHIRLPHTRVCFALDMFAPTRRFRRNCVVNAQTRGLARSSVNRGSRSGRISVAARCRFRPLFARVFAVDPRHLHSRLAPSLRRRSKPLPCAHLGFGGACSPFDYGCSVSCSGEFG